MKYISAILVIFLLLAMPTAAVDADGAAAITVQAPSALLMAADGTVLFEKNSHEKREPASVTKIMTMLLAMEALQQGSITLEDVVTATDHACSLGGSQIWMRQGEQFTVRELLKCVAVASANDCAVLLGEHIAGTEEAFVARMNQRAAELGMTDTRFVNCCGLPAEGHLSSAYDIGLMTCQLLKHPEILEYTTIWMDTIRNGSFGLTNTNKLIKHYDGMNGMKTGYTSSAGYCISATAMREQLQLIAVVMAEPSIEVRSKDITAMLNYGFANYTMVSVTPEQPVMTVPVLRGKSDRVLCTLQTSEPLLMTREQGKTYTVTTELEDEVQAPVTAGQQLGQVVVRAGERELARFPVTAAEDVPALTLWDCWKQLFFKLFD